MPRPWKQKFADAFRGLRVGSYRQSSFGVHFTIALAVLAAAALLRFDTVQWCIVLLCISGVLTAEMLSSALEAMARAVTSQEDPRVRDSLDIASSAVLLAAFGSAAVGIALFGHRAGQMLGWW